MMARLDLSVEKVALIIAAAIVLVLVILIIVIVKKWVPRRLKTKKFNRKWHEVQALCRHKQTWSQAVIGADNLLQSALKRRSFKGKTMGERLVSAQRLFTDNDAVWFAHKLRLKLEQRPDSKLRQNDVKQALLGIGQALKDLGAL